MGCLKDHEVNNVEELSYVGLTSVWIDGLRRINRVWICSGLLG